MASAAGGSGTGGGDRCGMHHLVFVMHLVALFWHSNDVFIRAHMETIFFLLDGFRESEPETKPRTLIVHPLWRGTMCSR